MSPRVPSSRRVVLVALHYCSHHWRFWSWKNRREKSQRPTRYITLLTSLRVGDSNTLSLGAFVKWYTDTAQSLDYTFSRWNSNGYASSISYPSPKFPLLHFTSYLFRLTSVSAQHLAQSLQFFSHFGMSRPIVWQRCHFLVPIDSESCSEYAHRCVCTMTTYVQKLGRRIRSLVSQQHLFSAPSSLSLYTCLYV